MISFEIGGGRIALYGDPAAPLWFLQMVDDHDAGLMESEAEEIAGLGMLPNLQTLAAHGSGLVKVDLGGLALRAVPIGIAARRYAVAQQQVAHRVGPRLEGGRQLRERRAVDLDRGGMRPAQSVHGIPHARVEIPVRNQIRLQLLVAVARIENA